MDVPLRAPDAFVLAALDSLGPASGARAVDLACGGGRHALELARRGYATHAWDESEVALERVALEAARTGLTVHTRRVDARAPCAERFDLVVVVDFLDRDVFARLRERLDPGGAVLLATFSEDFPGPSPSQRFRLTRGELRGGLPGLETRLYREDAGRIGLVAALPGRVPPRPA